MIFNTYGNVTLAIEWLFAISSKVGFKIESGKKIRILKSSGDKY